MTGHALGNRCSIRLSYGDIAFILDVPKYQNWRRPRVELPPKSVRAAGGSLTAGSDHPDDGTRRPPIETAVVEPLVPSRSRVGSGCRPVRHRSDALRTPAGELVRVAGIRVAGIRVASIGADGAGATQYQRAARRDLRSGAINRIAGHHRQYR